MPSFHNLPFTAPQFSDSKGVESLCAEGGSSLFPGICLHGSIGVYARLGCVLVGFCYNRLAPLLFIFLPFPFRVCVPL